MLNHNLLQSVTVELAISLPYSLYYACTYNINHFAILGDQSIQYGKDHLYYMRALHIHWIYTVVREIFAYRNFHVSIFRVNKFSDIVNLSENILT